MKFGIPNGALVQWKNGGLTSRRSGVQIPHAPPHRSLAQTVEPSAHNREVPGSKPGGPTGGVSERLMVPGGSNPPPSAERIWKGARMARGPAGNRVRVTPLGVRVPLLPLGSGEFLGGGMAELGEGDGLENRRSERVRGFESHFLLYHAPRKGLTQILDGGIVRNDVGDGCQYRTTGCDPVAGSSSLLGHPDFSGRSYGAASSAAALSPQTASQAGAPSAGVTLFGAVTQLVRVRALTP